MKRSTAISLLAVGGIVTASWAYRETKCQPDANGVVPQSCSSSSSGRSGGTSSGFYSGSGSSSNTGTSAARTGSGLALAPSTSTARGGFGATGSSHSSGS